MRRGQVRYYCRAAAPDGKDGCAGHHEDAFDAHCMSKNEFQDTLAAAESLHLVIYRLVRQRDPITDKAQKMPRSH
jgi:hypothetical protein